MSFIPKNVPENQWKALAPKRAYAVKADKNNTPHFRFGAGGLFLAVVTGNESDRSVNQIAVEDGELTVLGRIKNGVRIVMGRSKECGFPISHAIMSRQHFEILVEENVMFIRDLGSTNGSFVHTETFCFDVDDYLAKHPEAESTDSTLDAIQEAFGPSIIDVLKKYKETFQKES